MWGVVHRSCGVGATLPAQDRSGDTRVDDENTYPSVDFVRSQHMQRWVGERCRTLLAPARNDPVDSGGDPRGSPHATARHRPRRDLRMARVLRRPRRRPRPRTSPLRHAPPARARPRDAGRGARLAQHRLHQHHPVPSRAVVPRRRGHRAPDPRLHPLERRGHGLQRQPQGARGGWPHRHVPVLRQPLRGRLQPLLPRQGTPGRRRPDLHPGPRLPRHLRPVLSRGPAQRDAAVALPPGGPARDEPGAVLLPASRG